MQERRKKNAKKKKKNSTKTYLVFLGVSDKGLRYVLHDRGAEAVGARLAGQEQGYVPVRRRLLQVKRCREQGNIFWPPQLPIRFKNGEYILGCISESFLKKQVKRCTEQGKIFWPTLTFHKI